MTLCNDDNNIFNVETSLSNPLKLENMGPTMARGLPLEADDGVDEVSCSIPPSNHQAKLRCSSKMDSLRVHEMPSRFITGPVMLYLN